MAKSGHVCATQIMGNVNFVPVFAKGVVGAALVAAQGRHKGLPLQFCRDD
jgi:hypothetical protein